MPKRHNVELVRPWRSELNVHLEGNHTLHGCGQLAGGRKPTHRLPVRQRARGLEKRHQICLIHGLPMFVGLQSSGRSVPTEIHPVALLIDPLALARIG